MPFKIIRNDITKVDADAIVNAANPNLKMGAGVCGAVFAAAGRDKLSKACDKIGHCNDGEAVITKGFNLPAKYIIHTVGPVWIDGKHGEQETLYAAYTNSMKLALSHKCKSIAFPLISSGHFHYPKDKALETAISAISDFLDDNEIDVYLVVFDKESFKVSKKRLYEVQKFID
ncbi:MAG: macro domain-containing protein, partial [Clostridia bacterium]|nr:macro domain-containing protein [Clostridia bacterium]